MANLGFRKSKKDRVKEFPISTSKIQPKAKEAAVGKSARILTASPPKEDDHEGISLLQSHGLQEKEAVPAIAVPIPVPEKPIYKIYADKIYIIEEKKNG
jgi:hypothetical protein